MFDKWERCPDYRLPTTLVSAFALDIRFYDEQNEHIRALLKPLSKHAEEAQDAEDSGRLPVKIAVWASLAANCCLAILQLYAAASSLSLSFFGACFSFSGSDTTPDKGEAG